MLSKDEYLELSTCDLNGNITPNVREVWNHCLTSSERPVDSVNGLSYKENSYTEMAQDNSVYMHRVVKSFTFANDYYVSTSGYNYSDYVSTMQNKSSALAYDGYGVGGYLGHGYNSYRPVVRYIDNDKSTNLYY